MRAFEAASPTIKVLLERVGRPEIRNQPDLLRPGGAGAVIVCNHVGWADSLWLSYAVYPRSLRHLSKSELFSSALTSWVLRNSGSMPIDRATPAPGSIKSAVDLLRRGELLLIFPAGTRKDNALFKRGAATIALHAHAPIVPALYEGPASMRAADLLGRPSIKVTFGPPISTADMAVDRRTAIALTERLQTAVGDLRAGSTAQLCAA